jgi:tetratricopeptide (TPR) repeat protein
MRIVCAWCEQGCSASTGEPMTVRVILAFGAALLLARPAAAQDLLAQARAELQRGQVDSAWTTIQSAAEAQPNRAEAHYWLGQIAGARAGRVGGFGAFSMARRCKAGLARAVELEPENPTYLEGLAGYLAQAPGIVGGDRDSALALARHLRRLDASRGASLMADVLHRGNRDEQARADSIMEAFTPAATDRPGQVRLAVYWANTDRPERALAAWERLAARDTMDVLARYGIGRNLVVLKREPRRAIAQLLWVVRQPVPPGTGPSFPPPAPWWRLGQAYTQVGRPDSARAAYLRALEIRPQYPPARLSLDSLAHH